MAKLNSEIHRRIYQGIFLTGLNILSVILQVIFMPFEYDGARRTYAFSDETIHRLLILCGIIQLIFSFISLFKYKKSLGDINFHKKAASFNFISLLVSIVSTFLVFSAFIILSLVTIFLTMDLWLKLFIPAFMVCFSSAVFLALAFMRNNISD